MIYYKKCPVFYLFSCIDGINSFTCACPSGYTGLFCETDIDECDNNKCQRGSTCKDIVGAYMCICPPGWNGTHCENSKYTVCDYLYCYYYF